MNWVTASLWRDLMVGFIFSREGKNIVREIQGSTTEELRLEDVFHVSET